MTELGRKRSTRAQTTAAGFALVLLAAALALTAKAGSKGPDVTVFDLPSVRHYTTSGAVNGYRAYSVGTTSCNVGDAPLWWCDEPDCDGAESNEHPVIAQNLYRLDDGRFEQVGMSWLKHGFLSLNTPAAACGSCQQPPEGPDQLGVGCTDAYDSSLNGTRPLGLRSEVDPATGAYPFPETTVNFSATYDQRIKVWQSDLDPAIHPGARFWVEGHYIAPDDALAGNGHNNASYREVAISAPSYSFSNVAPTVRERPAIYAWPAVDPDVEILDLDVPGTQERFHVARKVTAGQGTWHYEYAVHNHNSASAARALTVGFPVPTAITEIGFRDVDHHSGEPYATTDWDVAADEKAASVTWSTETAAENANANALRWGTMFSFWFDADSPPTDMTHRLELFTTSTVLDFALAGDFIFRDGFESGDTSAWVEGSTQKSGK